jgi:hypothetical protein
VQTLHYDGAITALPTLANRLFPTAGAIDEELQIGRASVIVELRDRFGGGRDTLIIEPRQVGKTSALRASLQATRRAHDVVIASADLKADAIENSGDLGARLVETAVEDGLSGALLRQRLGRGAGKVSDALATPAHALAAAAEALGVPAQVSDVIAAIEHALDRVGRTPFNEVLAALEGYAQMRGRRTIVFLDEVQEIEAWEAEGEAVEKAVAAAARRPHRQLRFVFAGSLASALEGLFANDRPLHVLSDRYPLPAIAEPDWVAGLQERLGTGGLECGPDLLARLIAASRGHPLATMYAAKEVFLAARTEEGRRAIERVHLEDGLSRARAQLWWKEFTAP